MDALQKVQYSSTGASTSSYIGSPSHKAETAVSEQFPAGLKVLVVDDDVTCLRILEKMLRKCMYNVTTCSQATVALNLVRERKGSFDLVLSDVHMPDMDGFKLLELVGLEMDLPVIMMSADGRTSAVMRGIRHGACDYLIKPIREEELKNIWQHVVRKKWNGSKENEHSGSLDDNERSKRGTDDVEYASSVNTGTEGVLKAHKKRREAKDEDDGEQENDDPSAAKKPRVVWSVELHQQFVSAVNQLGIDKAVPKRILELMNVPGLSRENVASHLQKFRLYLKRLSGVAQQQGGIPNSYCGSMDQNAKLASLGRYDIQALAASGQIPPQTLAALHAELLGRPQGSLVLPAMDQPPPFQASLQGSKCIPSDNGVAYGQPIMKCPPNIPKHIPQTMISSDNVHSGFGSWPNNGFGGLSSQDSSVMMGIIQQQHFQNFQQQKPSILPEPNRSINVQPSCLVVPSQSSIGFQAGNSPASVNQDGNFNGTSAIVDYGLISPPSHSSSFGFGTMSDRELRTTGLPVSQAAPSSSVFSGSCSGSLVQNSILTSSGSRPLPCTESSSSDSHGFKSFKPRQGFDFRQLRNLGFVGKGTSIPSRFAVDEPESPRSNLNHGKIYGDDNGNKVKQEPDMGFMENAGVGIPTFQHFSSNDLTSVFSE